MLRDAEGATNERQRVQVQQDEDELQLATNEATFYNRHTTCLHLAGILAGFGVILFVFGSFHTKERLEAFLRLVDGHKSEGALAFVAVFSMSEVLFLPGSLLAVGAGAVFGLCTGVLLVWVGAAIGQSLAFFIGRHLLRESVTRWLEKHKMWEAIDRAIQRDGWQLAFLLRLAPSINCTLLNYALSLTAISFAQYFVVSVLATIPGICLFVYLGSVAKNIGDSFSEKDGSNTYVVAPVVASGAILVLVGILATRYARRALKDDLEDTNELGPASSPPETVEVLPDRSSPGSGVASGANIIDESPRAMLLTNRGRADTAVAT